MIILCAAQVLDDEHVITGCPIEVGSYREVVGNVGPHDGAQYLVGLCDEHAELADTGVGTYTITLRPRGSHE